MTMGKSLADLKAWAQLLRAIDIGMAGLMDEYVQAWESDTKRLATAEAEAEQLNVFRQAAIHVTENGKTARSFSASDGWAMVHKDRLLDLEISEDRSALWRERFLQMASGELKHRNAGNCPDDEYPDSRDGRCRVCLMMGE